MKRMLMAFLFSALSVAPVVASDHMNLEENLPTELEDAYPIKFRSREIQGIVRYIDVHNIGEAPENAQVIEVLRDLQ